MLRRRVLIAFAVLACGGPPREELRTASRCTLAAPELGPLRAQGRSFVDAQGRTVFLRGVNTGGRAKFAPYAPFDFGADYDGALARYLDAAASLGVNVLRVPFTWAAVEPTRGVLSEQYLARYAALLDAAAARGMFTIVDFHQDIYAEALCGDGLPGWTLDAAGPPHHDCPDWFLKYGNDPAVKAAFDSFWSDDAGTRTAYLALWDEMATRHAQRPGVIGFEPFNEPSPGNMAVEAWGKEVLRPFYEQVGQRVRAKAPDALVFVDATGVDAVSATTSLTRPTLDGLVFAPHYYDAAVLLGGSAIGAVDVATPLKRWSALGEQWGVPVVIGEFGVQASRPGAGPYARAHYDTFDRLGLSATFWEYSAAAELWNAEDLSIAGPDGGLYATVADEIARPFASRVAGELGSVAFRDGTFRLEYVAARGGITEVRLPSRRFGTVEVQTTGGVCVDAQPGRLLIRADEAGSTIVTFH